MHKTGFVIVTMPYSRQKTAIGLAAPKNQNREPFVVKPLALGLPPGMSYDKVSELLEMLEGPEYR